MLIKSGTDFFNSLKSFLGNSKEIHIYVPYIKLAILKELIEHSGEYIKSVTVRWEPTDIIKGSSDLGLYPYLKDKGIPLFRNPRLHLKAFVDNYQRAFMGSANISQRALNYPETANYNYELGVIVNDLTMADRLYFNIIETESILVTDEIYNQLESQLSKAQITLPKPDLNLEIAWEGKDFLISSLPMSYDIETLIKVYEQQNSKHEDELNCALHDLALYNIPLGLERAELLGLLKMSFFIHPFIRAFLENLDAQGEIYFGRAKHWIQQNCSDSPTPRKWEITTNIQILFRWIVELGDGLYVVDSPNYSERLKIVKE